MPPPLRVLFLASEADPFVKVGGLGDVAGSLPKVLNRRNTSPNRQNEEAEVDIRLAIPMHGVIPPQVYDLHPATNVSVAHKSGPIPAEIYIARGNEASVYLIAGAPIPPDAPVYSDDGGCDAHKYIFFSLAALEFARAIQWQPDIVHANDWHTAAAIYAISLRRDYDSFFRNTATLLTIHNLPFLGLGGSIPLDAFGLPPAYTSTLPEWARHLPLPLGLLTADHIVAVSPTYAREILTPGFGTGLQDFLQTRADSISGILNGLDTVYWNPATDTALAANFCSDNLTARETNKTALQTEFGLLSDTGIPLLAFIGRMDYQKGVDVIDKALAQVMDQPWQAILLGAGLPELEEHAQKLQQVFPDRVRAVARYDALLSRRIYAGADMLLIPSRYEPCGLVQMIAMRYGCVPIAHATGGLCDTVRERKLDSQIEEHENGFLFDNMQPVALAAAIRRALAAYADRPRWQNLQHQGMEQDFSWEKPAGQYRALYQSLVKARHRDR